MNKIIAIGVALIIAIGAVGTGFFAYSHFSQSPKEYITVLDDQNTLVKVPLPVNRVVSLAPSNTEILFSLGLGNKVVGDTYYDRYPPAAMNITKIGGVTNSSVEKIVSLKPGLILGYYGFEPNVINQLRSLGYAVVVLDPTSLSGIIHDINLVAYITGTTARANNLTNTFEGIMNNVTNAVSALNNSARLSVLLMLWYSPIWTTGSGSVISDLISETGAKNIAGSLPEQYTEVSREFVIQQNPDVIIIPSSYAYLEWTVKNDSLMLNVTAVKNNNFLIMPDPFIIQPGPLMFIGLEMLAKYLYPSELSHLQILSESYIFPS